MRTAAAMYGKMGPYSRSSPNTSGRAGSSDAWSQGCDTGGSSDDKWVYWHDSERYQRIFKAEYCANYKGKWVRWRCLDVQRSTDENGVTVFVEEWIWEDIVDVDEF